MGFKNFSLMKKILLPIVAVFGVGVLLLIFYISQVTKENTLETTVINAKTTIEQFKTLRAYYTKNVIKKVKGQTNLKISFDHKEREDAIPLPATMIHDLSSLLEKKEGTQMRLYSAFPFPNRRDRVLDDFAKEALEYFKNKPNDSFVKSDLTKGREIVRVAIADRMAVKACVNCHNNHPQTPKERLEIRRYQRCFGGHYPY